MNDWIKLTPALKDIIWGGDTLSTRFRKTPTPTRLGESWELSLHPDGICRVGSGDQSGMALDRYLNRTDFPTLIKLIDARDNLSVQVHPAKTEMWVVLDCEEGAELVYGLNCPFDEASFREALNEGRVESLLNYVPVHKGDVFFIPSGLVHAIGKGILIAEIQQSSNITYRVYDYGRLQNGKPRALHVDQAMAVIRDFTPDQLSALRFEALPSSTPELLAACDYFHTYRIEVQGRRTVDACEGWQCLLCIEGEGEIDGMPLSAGDCCFTKDGASAELCAKQTMTLLLTRCPKDAEPMPPLRVISYNIAHTGFCGLDASPIAEEIRKEAPDLVGLQEVDRFALRSRGMDTVKELSRLTALPYTAFAKAISLPGVSEEKEGEYGVAVLSRYPILSSRILPLPSGHAEQRVLLICDIEYKGRVLHFASTHLSYESDALRAEQFATLAQECSAMPRSILTGDFNIRSFDEYRALPALKGIFTAHGEPAYSFPRGNVTIDNIFISSELGFEGRWVMEEHNSDHCMIMGLVGEV